MDTIASTPAHGVIITDTGRNHNQYHNQGLEGKDAAFLTSGFIQNNLRDISAEVSTARGDNLLNSERIKNDIISQQNVIVGMVKDNRYELAELRNSVQKEVSDLKFSMFEKAEETNKLIQSFERDRLKEDNLLLKIKECIPS